MKKTIILTFIITCASLPLYQFSWKQPLAAWKTITPAAENRSENAFARVGDQFFLFGGRKKQTVEIYDAKAGTWKKGANVPMEMHHFQAIDYKGEVYVLGAFTGDYPHETPIPAIQIYNPKTDKWREGAQIPEGRRRGAAGVAVYKDKIYLVCGITDGHWDGHVTWVDEYDPKTDSWKVLPDAPRGRDHFQAAIVGDQMLVAGGRRSTAKINQVLNLTIGEVDVYDFKKGTWTTLPAEKNIPTQRAGCTSVTIGNQVIVIGGESPQKLAHNQTEAFNMKTNTWETLPSLQTGRHGTQAVVYKNKVYIAAGSANQGGGPEINSMEVLE
ncbi:galactose oxidase [Rhodocytophaga rosea]|uniref:Galactose oxidase n=1 Tax=Rhodocytophaga rosea TaxID=2704465 RepID=A0A6C0GE91_9BACT|nr:kelch repeat-containing protein [Rhodocytophaga rosea]QHT66144.1 galactose oxidase [Rhodocytophaga rosea]